MFIKFSARFLAVDLWWGFIFPINGISVHKSPLFVGAEHTEAFLCRLKAYFFAPNRNSQLFLAFRELKESGIHRVPIDRHCRRRSISFFLQHTITDNIKVLSSQVTLIENLFPSATVLWNHPETWCQWKICSQTACLCYCFLFSTNNVVSLSISFNSRAFTN